MVIPVQAQQDTDYSRALHLLRQGDLVVFPTETVYGLGADASNPDAVSKIFALKGRPVDHPVIVHVAADTDLSAWVAEITPAAQRLMDAFWPGPLTLIFKKSPQVLPHVTGGQATVGIRCPNHPVTQALLKAFGGGLAGPSANPFGRISPTTVDHVLSGFQEGIGLILDGGPCDIGIESTIVDVSIPDIVTVLRPGRIRPDALVEVAGVPVVGMVQQAPVKMRFSGGLSSHYAPRTPLMILPTAEIDTYVERCLAKSQRVGVWSFKQPSSSPSVWEAAPAKSDDYEQALYAMLHHFDGLGLDILVFEEPPCTPEWEALFDRLKRAGLVLHKHLPVDASMPIQL